MSEHEIPNSEADLLLHKYVTEHTKVEVVFVSANQSVQSMFTGYILSFTNEQGLVIGSELPKLDEDPPPCWIAFKEPITGNPVCHYVDETDVAAGDRRGSQLAILLPSGDRLLLTALA